MTTAQTLALNAQQNMRSAEEIANSVELTLEQALAHKKANNDKQSTLQIKNWYKQGWHVRSNGGWYADVGGVVRRKYYTV
jgi:hypothetical protein